jgi:Immunoglobulin domain
MNSLLNAAKLWIGIAALACSCAGQEVWLSAQTNALGTHLKQGSGTLANPYYGDFDYILNGLSNCTVHLLPGTHYSKGWEWELGDLYLNHGLWLRGAGLNATTIQRDLALHPDDQQHSMLQTWEDGVTVSDLTLDCAGSDALQYINGGIYLMGSACTVSNVKVIRCSGNAPNLEESVGIAVGDSSRYTSNSLIVSCVVTQVTGTYQGGICIGGYYTRAISNTVYMPRIEDHAGMYYCYGVVGTRECAVQGNYGYGGYEGVWTDTGCETNLAIADNLLQHTKRGISFGKSGAWGGFVDGLFISNNLIELSTVAGAAYGIDLAAVPPITFHNLNLVSNRMEYDNTPVPIEGVGIAIKVGCSCDTALVNLRIIGNTVDHAFSIPVQMAGQGTEFTGNVDSQRLPLYPMVLPWFCVHPQSQTANASKPVTLTCQITGNALIPVVYQWNFNGRDIAGATQSIYTFTAGKATAGNYYVWASNSVGVVNSAVAAITVPKGNIIPPSGLGIITVAWNPSPGLTNLHIKSTQAQKWLNSILPYNPSITRDR